MRILATWLFLVAALPARAEVHHVERMTSAQIRALDAARTVVLLPGGILEQHGPHLPVFIDGYSNAWLTDEIARALDVRGHDVLVFPIIPLGHEGANEIGAQHVFPGTYSVRRSTLRAIFMDLGTELGEQGFRRVFVIHGHGAPLHNLVLDQAARYFADTYGGTMVHLRGLQPTPEQAKQAGVPPRPDLGLDDTARREIGIMDEHAGFDETSRAMFLQPDLVAPVAALPSITVETPPEFFAKARVDGWPGYLSAPRLATRAAGEALQRWRAAHDTAMAVAILDGVLDARDIPRYSTTMTGNPAIMDALDASEKNEATRAARQRAWLQKNGIE